MAAETMRAVVMIRPGSPKDTLQLVPNHPRPERAADELLIEVVATGVSIGGEEKESELMDLRCPVW